MPLDKDDSQETVVAVVLGFHHPSIDPTEISACLQLTPTTSAARGTHYVTVRGENAEAIHRTSKWALYRYIAASDSDVVDVSEVLRELLSRLELCAAFVRRLGEEGHGWVGLQFAGAHYRGLEVPPEILARASGLKLSFGIEVFPHGFSGSVRS